MEVPQLIADLALMLTTAAVVTIVFRKLRIPTILGYIVAGFLIGPNFPLFMNIESAASVETWSEIGVVVILILAKDLFHRKMKHPGQAVQKGGPQV